MTGSDKTNKREVLLAARVNSLKTERLPSAGVADGQIVTGQPG